MGISTAEAARRLGVSIRRIQALVNSGQLGAEKVSGVWLVDEESVDRRAKSVSKAGGRPVRGAGRNEARFTFMNREHEICEVVYDVRHREFTSLGEPIDKSRAPIGVSMGGRHVNLADFNRWWRGRGIPGTRVNIDRLLREAGVAVPEELLYRNLGLSLSDQYWIRPMGSGLEWGAVNFFHNGFDEMEMRTAPYVAGSSAPAHPSNTSDGNLEKTWVVRGGVRMLKKSGFRNNQEPYNEVVATSLHRRLLADDEYVNYTLEGQGLSACSLCANFISDEEEYIPAIYVQNALEAATGQVRGVYRHYLDCCDALGAAGVKESLDRMIVCDDILANTDRHFRNFGLVRNVETLECRPAPLFDSGSSLWCDLDESSLAKGVRSFASKQFYANPARQLLLVDDFSWFHASSLDGFSDEACSILEANDAIGGRLPYIRSALEWRIERMIDIAEWS